MKLLWMSVLAAAAAAGPGSTGDLHSSKPVDGVFCAKTPALEASFAGRERPDGNLVFALDAWEGEFSFGLYGVARPEGERRWSYARDLSDPDKRCKVTIGFQPDGTPRIEVDPIAQCRANRGAGSQVARIGFAPKNFLHHVRHELDEPSSFFEDHYVDC